ncbi:MAG: hypothetical protein ACOC1D_01275 [Prolixibacteraceae bacterium]
MKQAVKKIEDHDFIIEMRLPEKGIPSVFDADLICIISPPYKQGDVKKFIPVLENILAQEMIKLDPKYEKKIYKSQVAEPGKIMLKTQFELKNE